ncbi:MAG: phytoene desaturase family protein [Brevefilum sp.]
MTYDVIVVGGGASGLTAAAFLAKQGHATLLVEKEPHCGGLINSFIKDGFTFDGGIRALDNAGVMFPMLKQLGIEIDFVKNHISVGIEDEVVRVESDQSLDDYEALLHRLYPEAKAEISAIMVDIRQMMRYMQIQYGIKNPIFLDFKQDRDYFIKEVFPWMFKYALNVRKVAGKDQPVADYLQKFTQDHALIDIFTQHFFTETPAYFALSYFTLYQDYYYPKAGTGTLVQRLTDFITANGGEIRTGTAVESINLDTKTVTTQQGDEIGYHCLLWTADQKALYNRIDEASLKIQKTHRVVQEKKAALRAMRGNDSVFTLFLASNLDKGYFEEIATGHFFYTPSRKGESSAGPVPINGTWEEVRGWLERFFALTTYEIAIPALRDSSLAPPGKTGLIISALFDYHLTKYIYDQGWEEAFKDAVTEMMINTLDRSIYPGLSESVIDSFTATPMTIQKMTGSTDGAITGWSFTNHPMPAENRLIKIASAVNTPLPDVYQAGQWTYSPSGLPVSLITGKLAADKIGKQLKKSQ